MNRAHPLRIADYLRHILDAIDNIQTYTAGFDLVGFMADRKSQDADKRHLESSGSGPQKPNHGAPCIHAHPSLGPYF